MNIYEKKLKAVENKIDNICTQIQRLDEQRVMFVSEYHQMIGQRDLLLELINNESEVKK